MSRLMQGGRGPQPLEAEPLVEPCHGCFGEILEGDKRYNCTECVISCDLCARCHGNGKGDEHMERMGALHRFVLETVSHLRLTTLTYGETLEQTMRNMFSNYAARPALGCYDPDSDSFMYRTYAELQKQVEDFACGLRHLLGEASVPSSTPPGTSSPTTVGICAISRLEWYITDFACVLLGIPTVPLGVSIDRESMTFILNQTELTLIVCSRDMLLTVMGILPNCPTPKTLIVMETSTSNEAEEVDVDLPEVPSSVKLLSFSEVTELGRRNQLDLTHLKPDPDSIFSICYTSGSTGRPKGCVFTRQAWNATITENSSSSVKKVWLSFHPPAHAFERRSLHLILAQGGKVGLYRGSMEHLMDDFALVRPTVVASTPRFWTLLYNQYLHALYKAYTTHLAESASNRPGGSQDSGGVPLKDGTGVGQEQNPGMVEGETAITDAASSVELEATITMSSSLENGLTAPNTDEDATHRTGKEGNDVSDNCDDKVDIVEEGGELQFLTTISSLSSTTPSNFDPSSVPLSISQKVFEQFRSILGGREHILSTGGAATSEAVKMFMVQCFWGLPREGYGTTESGGITSNGVLHSNVTVKLIDVPEMGYFTSSDPPQGEICVKTPNTISGYYKDPKLTAEKFVDGYFRTGDIGEMIHENKLKIIDRKKNIFKLAQGEFVAPEQLENLYISSSPLIGQMYIYGNSLQSNVVAVVVPYEESVRHHMAKGDEERALTVKDYPSLADLCKQPEVKALYLRELRSVAQTHSLQGWEVPVDILLDPQPFSTENGLLTSTFKQCRPALERRYREELEELYRLVNEKQMDRPMEVLIVDHFKQLLMNTTPASAPPLTTAASSSSSLLPKNFLELTLSQLGGDSLTAMRLSGLLRDHLHADLTASFILQNCLGKVLESLGGGEFVEERIIGEELPGVSEDLQGVQEISWNDEVSLDNLGLEVLSQGQEQQSKGEPPQDLTVLLTGATGFLGRFILLELLQSHQCGKIYCLVREKEGTAAEERILNILRDLLSELHSSTAREQLSGDTLSELTEHRLSELTVGRLSIFCGDLSLPRLGVNEEEFSFLCESVDVVIHNGAVVNHVLPYASLKLVNVGSTKEILRLVCSGRPKFLHYISTIGVFAQLPWEHIDEETLPSQNRLHHLCGYSQSKWVSEQLVLQAIQRKLVDGNVSRPGLIGPHSVSGHGNTKDWVCWLVRGVAGLGSYPVGSGCDEKRIDWMPVDQMARAVIQLSIGSHTLPAGSHVFHLVDSAASVTFTDLLETLRKLFVPCVQTCGYSQFRRELSERAKGTEDRVLGSLDLLLPQRGGWAHSRTVSCGEVSQAVVTLAARGSVPDGTSAAHSYVERYLLFLKSKQLF